VLADQWQEAVAGGVIVRTEAGLAWLGAGLLLGAVVPVTLIVISSTNKRLEDHALDTSDEGARTYPRIVRLWENGRAGAPLQVAIGNLGRHAERSRSGKLVAPVEKYTIHAFSGVRSVRGGAFGSIKQNGRHGSMTAKP
jgi:hypothetical protein